MANFQRNAIAWLQRLFPPSTTPGTTNPFVRSDDVQLVQLYDGGGFMPNGHIPVNWFPVPTTVLNPGPSTSVEIFNRSILDSQNAFRDNTLRVFVVQVFPSTAPTVTTTWSLQLSPQSVPLTNFIQVTGPANFTLGVFGQDESVVFRGGNQFPPLLGPRINVIFRQEAGGSAASDFTIGFRIYGVTAPLGSAFTL